MNDEPTDNYTYTCDAGGCDGLTIAIIDTGEHDAGWISMCHNHASQHLWQPKPPLKICACRWDEQDNRDITDCPRHRDLAVDFPNPERYLPPELQPCPWVCPQHHRHCNHLGTPPHAHACIFCDTTEQGAIEREAYLTNVGITAVPGMKEAIKAAANEEQKQAREAASKRCICPDQPDRFDGQHMINCPRSMINKGLPVTMFRTNYFSIDDVDDQDVSSPRQPPSKNYASAPSGHRLAGASLRGRIRRFFPKHASGGEIPAGRSDGRWFVVEDGQAFPLPRGGARRRLYRAWNDAHLAGFGLAAWALLILYEGWDRLNEFLDHLRERKGEL